MSKGDYRVGFSVPREQAVPERSFICAHGTSTSIRDGGLQHFDGTPCEQERPEGTLATMTIADKDGRLWVVGAVLGPAVPLGGGDPKDVRDMSDIALRNFKVVLP